MLDPSAEYLPAFPRRFSLECAEGSDDSLPCIEFTLDTVCKLNNLNKLRPGKPHRFVVVPLYHAHVLWSYGLCVARVGKTESTYGLLLANCGPHLSFEEDKRPKRNSPVSLREPKVLRATLTAVGENGDEGVTIVFDGQDDGNPLVSDRSYTHRELLEMGVNGRLHARIRITIARAFFALEEIVDLQEQKVTGKSEHTAMRILNGERPAGCDWTISTPVNDAHGQESYHVHKQKLAELSAHFKTALSTGRSVRGVIEMVPGEQRCVLSKFVAGELKQVVCVLYTCPLPHPLQWARVADLSAALKKLFGKTLNVELMYRHWERNICTVALEAGTKADTRKAFTYLVMAATIIWSCPYGSMPVAKRVVIGGLADLVHLHCDERSPAQFVRDTFARLLGGLTDSPHIPSITESLFKHLLSVSAVRKQGVKADPMTMAADMEAMTKLLAAMYDHKSVISHRHSLESAGGERDGDRIMFTRDFDFSIKAYFADLSSGLRGVQTDPFPVYYDHVLWSYCLRIGRVEDGHFAFSLANARSHISNNEKEIRAVRDLNVSKRLRVPNLLEARVALLDGEKKEVDSVDLKTDDNLRRAFSVEEFEALAVNGDLRVRVCVTLARAFFSLPRLIDLEYSPTVPEDNQEIVETILRGEKPAGADWEITVGEEQKRRKGQGDSGPSSFHVHKAAFAGKSDAFKKAFTTGGCFEDLIESTGDCSSRLHESVDLHVVLALVYNTVIPPPAHPNKAAVTVKTLQRLFKPDSLTAVLYPQWERGICSRALAIDKSSLSSLHDISRLLTLIWVCPYGSMPVAKRVAVGVMADMLHLNNKGDSAGHFTAIAKAADDSFHEQATITESVMQFLSSVEQVRKTLLAGDEKVTEDMWFDEDADDDFDEDDEEESGYFNFCNCVIL